jgi:hypothetical protein
MKRVIAGMEKPKLRGVKLGRPGIPSFTIRKVLELKSKGLSYKEIIGKLGISKSIYYQIVEKRWGGEKK